jgi:cytochrome c oxidase subunit IV
MSAPDHADHGSPEAIKKYVRTCIVVFVSLLALTIVTVAISYLHLPTPLAITVALVVAITKGSLVAAFFMHLISEVKLIFWVLLISVVFFAAVMMLPSLTVYVQGHLAVG